MYELYKINDDLYQIHSNQPYFRAMEGTLLAISVYMMNILGFDAYDVELAFVEMNKMDHDSTHFGIRMKFMWTFNKSEKYKKVG